MLIIVDSFPLQMLWFSQRKYRAFISSEDASVRVIIIENFEG